MARSATISANSRSLVFSEGSSNKFWKIELEGSSHTIAFGRIGTAGQTQTKDFPSDDAARRSFDKLVAEKLKKGYRDDAGSGAAASIPKTATTNGTERKPAPAKRTAQSDSTDELEAAAQPVAGPVIEIDPATTRVIALDPQDWLLAGFRPRQRLERGAPRPFDRAECLFQLAKLKTTGYGYQTRWHDLQLPPSLSAEEAHFWFLAVTTLREPSATMKVVADRVSKQQVTGRVDVATARKALDKTGRTLADELFLALANLLSPGEFVDLILQPTNKQHGSDQAIELHALIHGFNRYVAPYLSVQELESLRERVRQGWDPAQEPADYFGAFPAEYYLAASLGLHDQVYEVSSRWADDRYQATEYADLYQIPQSLVFGLGSAELVEREWRRLKLRVRSPEQARALLACTEYAALDCLANDVIAETNKEKCEALLAVLALVRAPEAAVPILNCKISARSPAIARDWLDTYVGHAVNGLLEVVSERGKLGDAALDYFGGLKRKGQGSFIADALKKAGTSEGAAKVQAEVLNREEKVYEPMDAASTPNWLNKALQDAGPTKRKPLPGWACAAMLPPLIIGEKRLNDEQVDALLQALAKMPLGSFHPVVSAIREHVDKHVRGAFAWKLFQFWEDDGFPSAGKWALAAIGHIGDDGCVLKLTPLIRVWPGESQHARAVFGLECLRAIGSSVALMQLSAIAQKLKFKGLKAKAEQFIDEIAKEMGLTRSELEDRVVPDCGLDENGRREFSFGPRSFSFVLGSDLKAMARDETGKLRPDLPKPGGKDDEALANASVAEWKLLKKQIKEVAAIQAGRLENAMVTGRRWSMEDFEMLLVRHPLMTHLVQKLIWAAFDAKGNKIGTFRVTEERDFADAKDNRLDLAHAHQVGVVHPLELSESERAHWGEVLSDYEVVAPFSQLGRAVYTLEASEEGQEELTRFNGLKLVAPTLVFTLEKLGWTRGLAMDGGGFDEHSKQFPAANVTAVVGYEGAVAMGYIDPNEMLTLETVIFCAGMRGPSGYGWNSEKRLKLGKVPPIVISEVLADMQVLKSKAK